MYKAIILAVSSLTIASVAQAAECVSGPESLYSSNGFSCNVGNFTFSNIFVDVFTSGSAPPFFQIQGGMTIDPVINAGGDAGLRLNYTADVESGGFPNTRIDITWRYNVVGVPSMTYAGFSLDGTTSGLGQAQGFEILDSITTLGLNVPGSTSQTFNPVVSAFVSAEQINSLIFDFGSGSAITHSMTTTFGVNPPASVPGPIAGTGVPGLLLAGFGFFTWWRKNTKSSL
jgi:hypothetical protein